jgi:hypothetical protein
MTSPLARILPTLIEGFTFPETLILAPAMPPIPGGGQPFPLSLKSAEMSECLYVAFTCRSFPSSSRQLPLNNATS